MSRIGIRADGGAGVGMGHVMRCMSLARNFNKNGHKVYFLSKLSAGIAVIEREGFSVARLSDDKEVIGLNSSIDTLGLDNELHVVINLLKRYEIDILIVDSYNVSEKHFISLKQHVDKLVYIDDENKLCIPADVIINGNLTAEYLGYRKYNNNQILLLGPQYNLIREEFKDVPSRIINETVESVMITTGGSDSFNITKKLLEMLLKVDCFSNVKFNVLVGSGFTHVDNLVDLSKRNPGIRLFSNQGVNHFTEIQYSSVSDLMLNSDIAISAGGSTLYEFAACGIPVLTFILAENQRFLVEKMSELGYLINLGWHHELDDMLVVNCLRLLIDDVDKRIEMSRRCQRLVDAGGAARVVRALT